MRIYANQFRNYCANLSEMREAHQPEEVQAPHRALWEDAQAQNAADATRTG